jgi:hypothetical protein
MLASSACGVLQRIAYLLVPVYVRRKALQGLKKKMTSG